MSLKFPKGLWPRIPKGITVIRVGLQVGVSNFSEIIFKSGKDIYSPKILDKLDYGSSASLNMHVMSWLFWHSGAQF